MTITRLQLLIIAYLATNGPGRFCDLAVAMAARPDTVNKAIGMLLEAGMIERCEIGQGGGVRLIEEKESEEL